MEDQRQSAPVGGEVGGKEVGVTGMGARSGAELQTCAGAEQAGRGQGH